MKIDHLYLKELLDKYNSKQCSDDELLELFEISRSVDFEEKIKQCLFSDFEQIVIKDISRKEIADHFSQLKKRIGIGKPKVVQSNFRRYIRYAAVILFPLFIGALSLFLIRSADLNHSGEFKFAVESGNKGYLELADGSKVWLNGNSNLLYADRQSRKVRLVGEAYFEIAHQKDKPFHVRTSHFDIAVYGTSFCVSSYETDETISVSLLEGSIGINDNGKELFKIHPGQMILYTKFDKRYSVVDKDMTDVSLWKEKELVIRDMNADQLFRKLSAWYQIDITNANKDPQKRMYNLVITNESLESILELIGKLSPLEYKIDGKEVTVHFK